MQTWTRTIEIHKNFLTIKILQRWRQQQFNLLPLSPSQVQIHEIFILILKASFVTLLNEGRKVEEKKVPTKVGYKEKKVRVDLTVGWKVNMDRKSMARTLRDVICFLQMRVVHCWGPSTMPLWHWDKFIYVSICSLRNYLLLINQVK